MSSSSDCIFCKIAAGEIPGERIAEDDRVIVILDVNPATRGHMLVVPREHTADVRDIGSGDLAACAAMGQRMATLAIDRLAADGVNLLHSCGPAAGQTVFHFHLHVIPRYDGDSLGLPWHPAPEKAEALDVTAKLLRNETAGK